MAVHRVPRYRTAFVGRADELTTTCGLLGGGRMITLVGPGGVGKTRLAAQVAAAVADRRPDGVWWVDLATARTEDEVVAAIAVALGLPLTPGEDRNGLAQGVAGRQLLLVLDNCEQAAAAVATVSDALLTDGDRIDVLATSRMPTGAAAERVRRLQALPLDDALALLLDRADAAAAPVRGTAAARRICDRLDRLPLALELAAGWAGTLTLDQIAEELGRPLELSDDRPAASAVPYRMRTLEGSVGWSHDLLDDTERTVFRRLGVFRPGFTADQLIAVCSDRGTASGIDLDRRRVLSVLRRLVDASLVVADTSTDVARYGLLEVIADYARARLAESGEDELVRSRHLAIYAELIKEHAALLDRDKDAWRAVVAPEYHNLVAAIDFGLGRPGSDDAERARRLAADLGWLWHLESGRREGLQLLRRAVELGRGERSVTQGRVLVAFALVADITTPGGDGYRRAEEGLEIASAVDDQPTARLARALIAIGAIGADLDQARRLAEETRAEGMRTGDVFAAEGSAVLLGILHFLRDEHRPALDLLEPSSAVLAARGDRGVASTALSHVALIRARTGDLDGAVRAGRQAVDLARPLHDLHRIGLASATLAEVLAMRGQTAELAALIDPIARLVEADPTAVVPGWARMRARIAVWQGDPGAAFDWCRREVRWLWEVGAADSGTSVENQLILVEALTLTDATGEAGSVLAGMTPVIERIGMPRLLASAYAVRGRIEGERDPEAAYEAHQQALTIRADAGLLPACVESLEAIAEIAPSRGQAELAVVLAAAAESLRAEIGYAARSVPVSDRLQHLLADPAMAAAVERGTSLGPGAIDLVRRMRGRRDRPASGWQSLTPTERAVVDLAVQGLTNPEIAERLFIGRGTVKTHLAHVYAKLGVANRTELTALHAERDHSDVLG